MRIGVVTTTRADWGIYQALLETLQAAHELKLFVGGTHLIQHFGRTEREIDLPVTERVDFLQASDSPAAIARSLGLAVVQFAGAFERHPLDLLLVLGDRFEMLGAALAAVPQKIPLAHLHGGELTFGATDDSFRHCLTKLSHLHFAATEEYAQRIRQLGEEPWRVHVSGAPGLDTLLKTEPLTLAEFRERFGVDLNLPTLLCTYHPVTIGQEDSEVLLKAVAQRPEQLLWTAPNADAGGQAIRARLERLVKERPGTTLVPSLGLRGYLTALQHCRAMVGNSSSGLLEAPSFQLPVVNFGRRQEGRVRARNVLDTGPDQVPDTLRQALSSEFRASLTGLKNPYGDGCAAEHIAATLAAVDIGTLLEKRFADWTPRGWPASFVNLSGSCSDLLEPDAAP